MYEIIYDRNFRDEKERYQEWRQGQEVPDIAPHRIIELHVDGDEIKHLEKQFGTITRNQLSFYGDMARTVFVNLERDYEESNARSTKK